MQSLSKADYSGYLKGITNKVKQYALNLSEIELKVEEATNNEPWGPHGTVMAGELKRRMVYSLVLLSGRLVALESSGLLPRIKWHPACLQAPARRLCQLVYF